MMVVTIADVDGGRTTRFLWLRPLPLSTLASATAIAAINVSIVTGVMIAIATGTIKTPARTARGGGERMRTAITTRATSRRNGHDCKSSKDNE